ncbi:MAG: hypothetical protein R2707_17380 [Acidimicrobiales bacterium]
MNRARIGQLLLVFGIVLVGAGVVGLLNGGDDSSVAAGPVTTLPSTTLPPTTLPPTTAAVESAAEFFVVFKSAFDEGDVATLVQRLNEATLERYGADQCQTYVASVVGNGFDAMLTSTGDVAAWDYVTDGVTTTLTDVIAADIERVVNGQTVPQTTHWQLVDGRYTWFTDCGAPR